MTLLDFWYVVTRYYKLVLATTVIISVLAGVHAVLKKPLYGATVVMTPAGTMDDLGVGGRLGGELGSLIGLGGLGGDLQASKNEAIAVLKSRQFTEQFIRDRSLMPILFANAWDPAKRAWVVEEPQDTPTIEQGWRRFDENIRFVSEDRETGIVSLEIRWFDRELAASWANDLVARLNLRMRQRTIDESHKNIEYLNRQLDQSSLVELRQAIFGLMEKNIRQSMLASGREEFAFRVIDPAMVPDAGNYLNPSPVLYVAVGVVLGLMLGVMAALGHFFVLGEGRRRRAVRADQCAPAEGHA